LRYDSEKNLTKKRDVLHRYSLPGEVEGEIVKKPEKKNLTTAPMQFFLRKLPNLHAERGVNAGDFCHRKIIFEEVTAIGDLQGKASGTNGVLRFLRENLGDDH
jgi:hypothetical protein